jgi:hypothetical protein
LDYGTIGAPGTLTVRVHFIAESPMA